MANVPAMYVRVIDDKPSEVELLRSERDAWRRLAEFLLKQHQPTPKEKNTSGCQSCDCH